MNLTLRTSINLSQKIRTSYNKRNVRYEEIHNLSDDLIKYYVQSCEIGNNFKILDHGSGYGAVAKEISNSFSELNLEICLQDVSRLQLDRAIKELSRIPTNINPSFFEKKLIDCKFSENYFDVAYSKIVLQEMPVKEQITELLELKRIVKVGGEILLWVWWLEPEYADFVRDIVREKDRIAKLTTLVKNRYFCDSNEFNAIFRNAEINIEKDVIFLPIKNLVYESRRQLNGDFVGDVNKLKCLNDYIRKRASKEADKILKRIEYCDLEDNISFSFPQMIIRIKNNVL